MQKPGPLVIPDLFVNEALITLTLLGESSTLALSCLGARQRRTFSIYDPSRERMHTPSDPGNARYLYAFESSSRSSKILGAESRAWAFSSFKSSTETIIGPLPKRGPW